MAALHSRMIGPKPHLDAVAGRIERAALRDTKLLRAAAALELEDQRPVGEPQARERRAGSVRQRHQASVRAPHRHDVEHRRHRPERGGRARQGQRILRRQQPEANQREIGVHLPADREGRVLEHGRRARQRAPQRTVFVIAPAELPGACSAARRHDATANPRRNRPSSPRTAVPGQGCLTVPPRLRASSVAAVARSAAMRYPTSATRERQRRNPPCRCAALDKRHNLPNPIRPSHCSHIALNYLKFGPLCQNFFLSSH